MNDTKVKKGKPLFFNPALRKDHPADSLTPDIAKDAPIPQETKNDMLVWLDKNMTLALQRLYSEMSGEFKNTYGIELTLDRFLATMVECSNTLCYHSGIWNRLSITSLDQLPKNPELKWTYNPDSSEDK